MSGIAIGVYKVPSHKDGLIAWPRNYLHIRYYEVAAKFEALFEEFMEVLTLHDQALDLGGGRVLAYNDTVVWPRRSGGAPGGAVVREHKLEPHRVRVDFVFNSTAERVRLAFIRQQAPDDVDFVEEDIGSDNVDHIQVVLVGDATSSNDGCTTGKGYMEVAIPHNELPARMFRKQVRPAAPAPAPTPVPASAPPPVVYPAHRPMPRPARVLAATQGPIPNYPLVPGPARAPTTSYSPAPAPMPYRRPSLWVRIVDAVREFFRRLFDRCCCC